MYSGTRVRTADHRTRAAPGGPGVTLLGATLDALGVTLLGATLDALGVTLAEAPGAGVEGSEIGGEPR